MINMVQKMKSKLKTLYHTSNGKIVLGDCLDYFQGKLKEKSVDLIVTSPPFGLVRKKEYGNVDADSYVNWFIQFGKEFKRVLKDSGSLVIDIGGAWIPKQPTRSLYHYELLIMLCKELGFNLAQEFYWWNPCKLPTPAEWVTVRRVRVKDAINCIWWLSKTPWPKASNTRVLQPYSKSMRDLLKNGYRAKMRPSGHDISTKFQKDNQGSIPPNLIAIAHTESNTSYLRFCKKMGLKPHPARFPKEVPEYFIRMLTDKGDCVIDPFAGSCATGAVAERLNRKWTCIDVSEEYLHGALGRFEGLREEGRTNEKLFPDTDMPNNGGTYYKLPRPDILWDDKNEKILPKDGGKKRVIKSV